MTRLTLTYDLRAAKARPGYGYDHDVEAALRSADPVRYLDAVAHDPAASFDARNEAADLLSRHVYPDAPDAGTLGRSDSLCGHCDRPDVDFGDWIEADMVGRSRGFFASQAACPSCGSEESLFDPDRPADPCRCVGCGVPIPRPSYPGDGPM